MKAETFCRHLSALAEMIAEKNRLEIMANELALYFDVEPHEVGLFKLDNAVRCARLIWPEHRLQRDVEIPITLFKTSTVSTVARSLTGLIDNKFKETNHLRMIEFTLAEKDSCIPIQKTMIAPGLSEGKLEFILQISRKGKDQSEAGPDFTEVQLRSLEIIAGHLTKLL